MLGYIRSETSLRWKNEKPFIDADSVLAVLEDARQDAPGILQPRRPFPDVLTVAETGDGLPRPREDLVIRECISYLDDPDRSMAGVYVATCGSSRVVVKLFIEEIDWPNIDWESNEYDKFEMHYVVCPEYDVVNEVRSYRLLRPAQ